MTVKNLFKKLVPGVLAVALTAGVIAPSGLTISNVKKAFVSTAQAEETESSRRVRFLGGELGDTITVKLIFHVDSDVSYVTVKNPNTGNEDKYLVANLPAYAGDGAEAGDYYVETAVYPKNMATSMIFKMYDAENHALTFGHSNVLLPESQSDYNEYSYSANDYLEKLRDSVVDSETHSIKSDATDKEKALYDLSRALLNYGEWCRFYFNKTNEPDDGNYANATNGISYPSWWTSKNYWASALDAGSNENFNAMLEKVTAPTVNYSPNHTGGPSVYKMEYPYVVSLVLEEGVKARLYFSGGNAGPSVTINDSPKNYESITSTFGDRIVSRYVETDLIKFGNLKESLTFNLLYDVNLQDTVTFSPISFARLVAIDKPENDKTYEESGLANTLRAMVTVETATYKYKNAKA